MTSEFDPQLPWVREDDLVAAGKVVMDRAKAPVSEWTATDIAYGRAFMASVDLKYMALPPDLLREIWSRMIFP